MSDAQGGYKLDEAQAVLRETKAIKRAITCGEKEKQDLIKVMRAPGMRAPGTLCVYKDFTPTLCVYKDFTLSHTTQTSQFS